MYKVGYRCIIQVPVCTSVYNMYNMLNVIQVCTNVILECGCDEQNTKLHYHRAVFFLKADEASTRFPCSSVNQLMWYKMSICIIEQIKTLYVYKIIDQARYPCSHFSQRAFVHIEYTGVLQGFVLGPLLFLICISIPVWSLFIPVWSLFIFPD